MSAPQLYKAHGIVLKRKNVGEADRIITVFTREYGKLRVIAKGIRRITSRRAPHLEVFSHVALMLHHGKTLDIVTEADLLDGFRELRKDLSLVNAAYHLSELVDLLLPERQEHRDVYVLLLGEMDSLDKRLRSDIYESCEVFAVRLLRLLGFLPVADDLPSEQIQPFIEQIVERRIRTYHFIRRS